MQSPLEDSASLARHARGSLDDMKAILNQGQKEIGVPGVSAGSTEEIGRTPKIPKTEFGKSRNHQLGMTNATS